MKLPIAALSALAALLVVFVTFSAIHYTANTAYNRGYQTAEADGLQRIATLQAEHANSLAKQYQAYVRKLETAQARSARAEKSYLAEQARLNHTRQTLQEQTHAKLRHQPDCHFTSRWVQHYSQALGLPTHDRSPSPAASTRSAPATAHAAANATTLLQHAEQYGHWCQSNISRLQALQKLLQTNKEQSW